MNKVFVEYRNKEQLDMLSNRASEPVEAIVTVSITSVNANDNEDIIYKEYHLHVGKLIGVDDLKGELAISDEDIDKLKTNGMLQFVKNENGLTFVGKDDAVFGDSQSLLSRVNMMLAKFDSLGYEAPDVLRKGSSR